MTNELSTERAIEALYTVRAYYASLTAGYPKGKDCRGIGDVMCSEIANSCLMAIKALEQQPCEKTISSDSIPREKLETAKKMIKARFMDSGETVMQNETRRAVCREFIEILEGVCG